MILICGDTHGEEKRLRFLAEHAHTVCPDRGEKKYLIICGDFGFDGRDGDFLQGLAQENGDLVWLFVDGNHENFDYLNGLPVDQWHGGNVHMLVRDKVIHLMRGEVFTIEGRRFFTFGGAWTVDWEWREMTFRRYGVRLWWQEKELPSQAERDHGLESLERVGFRVDAILTHTAPCEAAKRMGFPVSGQEYPLCAYLDEVLRRTAFEHWYFGHHHEDKTYWKFTCLMNDVVTLEAKEA